MTDESTAVRLIRVVCVDDVPDVGKPICDLINSQADMTCAAFVENNESVLSAAIEHRADVVVLDLSMPGRDSFEVIAELASEPYVFKVLAFSGLDDQVTCDRVFEAGAWGLASKGEAPNVLIESIRAVANGTTVFPNNRNGNGH
jgi:DNA-binding NarL/FixJ family response regulator